MNDSPSFWKLTFFAVDVISHTHTLSLSLSLSLRTGQKTDNNQQQLMMALSDPDSSDILTWLPHGDGFVIRHKR